MKIAIFIALIMMGTLASQSTRLQAQTFPSRPVRMLVPAVPGGGQDVYGRIISRALSDGLGVPVVVDNRGGASGRIGTEAAAKALPDGHTLFMGGVTNLATIPSADTKPGYDPVKDFAPISLVAISDYNLVLHPTMPARSVAEFIALAKSKPGQINYASVGTGSTSHFTWELFKLLAKIDILHVPYKGAGPAYTALLSGEVSAYFGSSTSIMPHVKAGRLKPIASTGSKRSTTFPDIPTMNETVPGLVSTSWYGVLAPAGTPKSIITKIHDLIASAPGVGQQIQSAGADPLYSSPEEFSAFIKTEMTKWSKVVKASGIRAE